MIRLLSIGICSILVGSCNNVGPVRIKTENILTSKNELPKLFMNEQHISTVNTNKELTSEEKKLFEKLMQVINSNKNLQGDLDKILEKQEILEDTELIQLSKNFRLNKN